MANQFTNDPTQDPSSATVGASVNRGGLPNMDPRKTAGYNPNDLGSMVDYFGGKGGSQSVTPFTDALGRPVTRIPGMSSYGAQPSAPAAGGAPPPPPASAGGDPNALDDQFGSDLKARAGGKRSPLEMQSDAMEAARAREQAASANRARLARYGFAPSSSLGLAYANQTDRQVAELMDRRQMQRETDARSSYMEYLSANEQKRKALEDEQRQRQALEAQTQYQTGQLGVARQQANNQTGKGLLDFLGNDNVSKFIGGLFG
jgi:hypothetical protein